MGGKLVITPALLRTPTGEGLPQCRRVGIRRRGDHHPTIRRCRPLPWQCRPLPYLCGYRGIPARAWVCTTVSALRAAIDGGLGFVEYGLEGPMNTALPSRAWTLKISSPAGQPVLTCSACLLRGPAAVGVSVQAIRQHLARHLQQVQLPPHLRTCQCREKCCAWHRRVGPCAGPLRLLLIRADQGRTWHLADTCGACAMAIPQAATVPEPAAPRAVFASRSISVDVPSVEHPNESGEWVEEY